MRNTHKCFGHTPLVKFFPLKLQTMHFTFGINGGEERWEILIGITVISNQVVWDMECFILRGGILDILEIKSKSLI
jgi:hypothetical protein